MTRSCSVIVQNFIHVTNDTGSWLFCAQIDVWTVQKYEKSYTVQFIAYDLGVAFVVVSAWHSELQRPEQSVVHLKHTVMPR